MRKAAFLLAMLVPGVVSAGPQEDAKAAQEADFPALIRAFNVPTDDDDFAQVRDLADAVEFETVLLPYASEWEAVERRVNHKVTSSIPASGDICRGAALIAIVKRRQSHLRVGWFPGFTFEIACEDSSITGVWNSSFSNWIAGSGLVEMKQTDVAGYADGLGHWNLTVDWQPVPPDPDDAYQWFKAVQWPVIEIDAAITRVRKAITDGEGEIVRGSVQSLAESALREVEGYPAFPDDDTLLAAEITFLTEVIADLDHGDLRKLVARADSSVPYKVSKKKSYKKKTKAIEKRWKKAHAKRLARYNAVTKAFVAAQGIDP